MKRIIYSGYTKLAAAVLFTVSITLAALTAATGVVKYFDEEEEVYGFENSFSETRHFVTFLECPESVFYNTYESFFETIDENAITAADEDEFDEILRYNLERMYGAEKINYYIEWNGRVYTNYAATDGKELLNDEFYSHVEREKDGNIKRETSLKIRNMAYLAEYASDVDVVISSSVKKDYADECMLIWEKQAELVNSACTKVIVLSAWAILLLIYLACVCGRDFEGKQKRMWIDGIWLEIHLAVTCICILFGLVLCMTVMGYCVNHGFSYVLMKLFIGAIAAVVSGVFLNSILSVVRNIKSAEFLNSSILFRSVRFGWQLLKKVLNALKQAVVYVFARKTGKALIGIMFAYTSVIGICGILTPQNPFAFITAVALFGGACVMAVYRCKDIEEVKKGAYEVRKGNVGYKIPEPKCEDMKLLASDINDIAKGLDESVAARVRAERLKTELITNVSHDLKTPVTSIISYAELLLKIDNLPEEARDYAAVISKKSEKLKKLTQDLFDISKVQSGNEEIVSERLDMALLINQSLGEYDAEIKKSELTFCVDVKKELYICADGRKLSRAIGNLLDNILKYSMKKTRVFITASEKDGEIVAEFKNIASYPMDFGADEIVGRFVRGDKSRTEDGNGLGLAIAKSYTEISGGEFNVIIDGDMFKTVIKFGEYR